MTPNRKDTAAGAFFVSVGLLYGGMALTSLPIGHALNMGPGYFPLLLAGTLIVLGSITLMRGLFMGKPNTPFGIVPWRAIVMLSLATAFFALLLREMGLLLTIFVSTLIASYATPDLKPAKAVVTCAGIALFCVGVFVYGIRLPVPVFGTWFDN